MERPWARPARSPRRVSVFCLAPLWSPHFETELEIIAGHRAVGDDVAVVSCSREMRSCLGNPAGHRYACETCVSRAAVGLDLAGVPADRMSTLSESAAWPCAVPLELSALRRLRVDGAPLGRGVVSSLVSIRRDTDPDLTGHADLVERLVESAVRVHRTALRHLRERRPDVVYVFNGRFASSAAVIEACRSLGVHFVTHEAGYELGTYRLIADGTVHDLEAVKQAIGEAWASSRLEEADRSALAATFFEGRRWGGDGDAIDEYRFTREQTAGRLPTGFEAWTGRRVVVFNSSEDEFAAIEAHANPLFSDQMAALEALAEHDWPEDVRLTLRVHPNLAGLENEQVARIRRMEQRTGVEVIEAASPVDSYELLERADAVVSFGSTIGAEALYWGRPSVLVGRAAYEELGPIRPTSPRELFDVLCGDLPVPDRAAVLPYGYFQRTWSIPFEHYDQETMRSGRFDGVRVRPTAGSEIRSLLLQTGAALGDPVTRVELRDRVRRGLAR